MAGLLQEKAVKVATVLADEIREKINKDLAEGNFTVVGRSREARSPFYLDNQLYDIGNYSEGIELVLDSGYEVSIKEV